MSKLTYKVRHNSDLSSELDKAKCVAQYAIKHRTLSSKDVAHLGLKSIISNQVLRKYGRNWKSKQVRHIKLTIPNQGLSLKDNYLWIPSLKLSIPFDKKVEKVNQVELDNQYAYVCCSVKDEPEYQSCQYIGVDLNATGHIAVAAVDSKIIKMGKDAPHIHRKYQSLRKNAPKKFVKKTKDKESRKVRDINHKISRNIVNIAKQKGYGIKLEKLQGIRVKKQGKNLNRTKSNWSFFQLQQFVEYKAKLLGVPVLYINPAYTSQRCSRCGDIGTREGKVFRCQHCEHKDHSDANAAFNIQKASITNGNLNTDRDVFKSTTDSAQVGSVQLVGTTTEPTML
jgi:putative transposase